MPGSGGLRKSTNSRIPALDFLEFPTTLSRRPGDRGNFGRVKKMCRFNVLAVNSL
jgi:hypothetical protein